MLFKSNETQVSEQWFTLFTFSTVEWPRRTLPPYFSCSLCNFIHIRLHYHLTKSEEHLPSWADSWVQPLTVTLLPTNPMPCSYPQGVTLCTWCLIRMMHQHIWASHHNGEPTCDRAPPSMCRKSWVWLEVLWPHREGPFSLLQHLPPPQQSVLQTESTYYLQAKADSGFFTFCSGISWPFFLVHPPP